MAIRWFTEPAGRPTPSLKGPRPGSPSSVSPAPGRSARRGAGHGRVPEQLAHEVVVVVGDVGDHDPQQVVPVPDMEKQSTITGLAGDEGLERVASVLGVAAHTHVAEHSDPAPHPHRIDEAHGPPEIARGLQRLDPTPAGGDPTRPRPASSAWLTVASCWRMLSSLRSIRSRSSADFTISAYCGMGFQHDLSHRVECNAICPPDVSRFHSWQTQPDSPPTPRCSGLDHPANGRLHG